METCSSAHDLARTLWALRQLIPLQYAKLFLKRNKNNAADAEATFAALKFIAATSGRRSAII